jgi:hypothetical protein
MDNSKNGVPLFNGQNGLSMRYGEEARKYFYKNKGIIFGYQLLHDMIVQKGKILQPIRN